MAHAFARIYLHVVFSTKNRERLLTAEVRPALHSYAGGILNGLSCVPVAINSEPDHMHLLFLLARTVTIAEVVGAVKKSSNDWLKKQGPGFSEFYWQSGYGAFSVSESAMPRVRDYIREQAEHHRTRSFRDEYRSLLQKHGYDPDNPYIWE